MRARGFVVIAAVAGLVYAYGSYALWERWSAVASGIALMALAAYAVETRRPWPVAAVAAALAVAVTLPLFWYEQPFEFGWTSYAPLGLENLPDEVRAGFRHATENLLVKYRWVGLASLAAALLLAYAASKRQRERSGRIMIAAAVVAVLMVGVELYNFVGIGDELGETLFWAWPALLAALVFLGAAVLAGDAVGAVAGTLLGMWALTFADTVARTVPVLHLYDGRDAFLEPGVSVAVTTQWSLTDPWAALVAVVLLLGVGLLVVLGPLHRPAMDRVAG